MNLDIVWTADRDPPRDFGRGRIFPEGLYKVGFSCGCYGWNEKGTYDRIGLCAMHNQGKWSLLVQGGDDD